MIFFKKRRWFWISGPDRCAPTRFPCSMRSCTRNPRSRWWRSGLATNFHSQWWERGESPASHRKEPAGPENCAPVIVRNTCRSGVRIVSPSDCVVLGDVNPGAEIIAEGDVVVFGALRGLAHAGAGGERTARIWALSIEPNQIRIADLVAVPPRGIKPVPTRFEVAEIQNGVIQVISL